MGLIGSLLFSDRAPEVLRKNLDLNAKKVAISASNISNSETPGYKAQRFEFQSVLQQATEGGQLPMRSTNGRHLVMNSQNIRSISGITDVDLSQGRMDGNNVSLEKEMVEFSSAQIAYDASVTAFNKRMGMVRSAITDAK